MEAQLKPSAAIATDPAWYKDAIIYQLHVKSFFDGNNDGIGDFAGLISKLDYVAELGVNTIWLLPFYPSPLLDDGYDISDYRNVHADYGTLGDFRHFIRQAHARGIRVITELVVNHTSDRHPWFQRARRAKPGSPWRNYYVWSETDQKYAGTRIIFVDSERSNWAWDPEVAAYYWHRFYSHQPDLNFDNPQVLKSVMSVMRFWLQLGVDGLRLDAVPYLVEREGTTNENLPETHAILKTFRAEVDRAFPGRMLLAEVNQWPEDTKEYFGDGDECHMAFHFPLMPRMYMAIAREDRFPISDIMRQTPPIPETCQWAVFLRNHDELTLEMVTDSERDYLWQTYASDRRARLNLGIRRRLAPLLERDRRRVELMNSLLLSMPGTPVIYYGDEIGMGDNIHLGDRNGVRTPMQWSPDRNGGFSRADPAALVLPPIMDPVYGYNAVNVEAQSRDPHSVLNWMRRMLAVRRGQAAFGRGTTTLLYPKNRKILAYLREYRDDVLLCVANLAHSPQAVELELSQFVEQVDGDRVGGHPHADGGLSTGGDLAHERAAGHDEGEWTGPVGVGQAAGARHSRGPRFNGHRRAEVHDQRVAGGAALDREDPRHGGGVGRRRRRARRRSRSGRRPDRRPAAARLRRRRAARRHAGHGVQELERGVDEGERLRRGEVVDVLQRHEAAVGQGLDERVGRAGEVLVAEHDEHRARDGGQAGPASRRSPARFRHARRGLRVVAGLLGVLRRRGGRRCRRSPAALDGVDDDLRARSGSSLKRFVADAGDHEPAEPLGRAGRRARAA